MSGPDIEIRAVLWSGLTLATVVAAVIGATLALLHVWHEPPAGMPSGAASLVSTLRSLGPALQSAPQVGADATRAAAASQARR
jgi:hypothetical protein